jgi:hypothetical protein
MHAVDRDHALVLVADRLGDHLGVNEWQEGQ